MTASPGVANDRLVWIDLEMTGLAVERDVIVEIACIVTDGALEHLDDGVQLVVHQDEAEMANMDEFVRNMHRKSGLLPLIPASNVDLAQAEKRVLDYVRGHVGGPRNVPLCGNSIGMDRRFLAHYMPDLDNFLHYRSIDVSSFKEVCKRWYPEVYRGRPDKSEQHRALDDIRESIEELRYYRDHLLIPRPDSAAVVSVLDDAEDDAVDSSEQRA